MNCNFCGKLCKSNNSLIQHRIRCKLNPDKIEIVSNFIGYNQKVKDGIVIKENTNQFIKARNLGFEIFVSDETKNKISISSSSRLWSDDQKVKHSKIMSDVVRRNPNVYSNKQRRTIQDYKGCKFDSSWEVIVAKSLDGNNVEWERVINPIEYVWEGKVHLYFPDFYLKQYSIFVEVKGYKTDRDIEKWKSVKNLLIIEKKEIRQILKGEFDWAFIPSDS